MTSPHVSRAQLNAPVPTTPLKPPCRLLCTIATPIPQMAAQPVIRTNRGTMPFATGPSKPRRRATHGNPASAAAPTSTRTRSVTLSGSAGGAVCQLSHTTHATAATTAAAPIQ